ncbi:MAG: cardiolipin synthase [Eubacteriales bacterium]
MTQFGNILLESIYFISDHIVIFTMLCAIVVVFFQRKEPKSTWAWLLLLYFIPIWGFFIYLLAGTDIHKRKMFRVKEIEDRMGDIIRRQEFQIASKEVKDKKLQKYLDLIYYNLESVGSVVTEDNSIETFTEGSSLFIKLKEDLKQAQNFIHLQYYIIRDDFLFEQIKDILIQKAKEGIEVRILYDGMGSREISKKQWKILRDAGIETAEFFPALLRRFHLRINYRNHRKIVIIDNEIGYVGGFNIGKEYLGLSKKFGSWRDTQLRIQGMAVGFLQIRFLYDWNYASDKKIIIGGSYIKSKSNHEGDSTIQIISSGPDSFSQNIRDNYFRLISKAEKKIYIQTPYFVPDETIITALLIAVKSGIEVNVMIPCMPDHPFVYWATYSYIGDLVMAGAQCYTYEDGFLHAKGMIIDDEVYCYGTANMDIRSFALNFEVNAIVYDEVEAKKMVAIFEQDLKHCKQITKEKYSRRVLKVRVKEKVSRLLSPLL